MKFNIMTTNHYPVLYGDDTLQQAYNYFRANQSSQFVVIDNKNIPRGVLTIGTLLINKNWGKHVSECMRKDILTVINADDLEKKLRAGVKLDEEVPIIVVDNVGKYRGVVSVNNVMKALYYDVKYIENILNSINAGIVAIDEEKKVMFFNDEWKRIHSQTDESLIGEDIMGKFPESLLTVALSSRDSIVSQEALHFKYSGATVLPFYTPMIDENAKTIGSVAIVRDYSKVSDLAINLRELKSLNNLFSSIFNNLTEIVFSVDIHGMISYANPVFTKKFMQFAGESLHISKLKEVINEIFKESITTIFDRELILHNDNGEQIIINLSCLPLSSGMEVGNGITGVVCIMEDITNLKKLKHKIEKSTEILQYLENRIYKLPEQMVCKNQKFQEVMYIASKVAKLPISVLIEGENGVGKELVANYIHINSNRSGKPFIPVNCGAIPESLWESEMFGYEEGAFTGAKKGGKMGIFELANHGTVFLDEISEISSSSQVKMLRFLQNMEISKVGRTSVEKLDVRIIAATNACLEDMVTAGSFRIDLYYRLDVVRLYVPPLRERVDEILPLTEHFINKFQIKYNKNIKLSPEAAEILLQQQWLGNVRQLQNVIEYCVAMCDDVILPIHLPQHMGETFSGTTQNTADIGNSSGYEKKMSDSVKALEAQIIQDALEATNYNKTKAMKMLNISRKTFYKKLKEYGLCGMGV